MNLIFCSIFTHLVIEELSKLIIFAAKFQLFPQYFNIFKNLTQPSLDGFVSIIKDKSVYLDPDLLQKYIQ